MTLSAVERPTNRSFSSYINSDRSKTEELLKSARKLGVKAVSVTVDAPVPSKRASLMVSFVDLTANSCYKRETWYDQVDPGFACGLDQVDPFLWCQKCGFGRRAL